MQCKNDIYSKDLKMNWQNILNGQGFSCRHTHEQTRVHWTETKKKNHESNRDLIKIVNYHFIFLEKKMSETIKMLCELNNFCSRLR